MLRNSRFLAQDLDFIATAAFSLCLLLSACGGGGGGESFVANIPPPPSTAPPPAPSGLPAGTVAYSYSTTGSLDIKTSWLDSPATRAGSYDLIGRLTLATGNGNPASFRLASPGEFGMTVSSPTDRGLTFTLNGPPGTFPGGKSSLVGYSGEISWDINPTIAFRYANPYGDTPQYFGERLAGFDKASDGSERQLFSYDFARGLQGSVTSLGSGNNLHATLDYDVGFSYVAMGEWSWRIIDLNGAAVPGSDSGDLLFVNGDRTPGSAIPVSGTATYDARSLALWSDSGVQGIPFSLTADFSQRTMATRIDQDYRFTSSVDRPILGIHVGGSSPFDNNGLFDIPLAGTANYSATNAPVMPPSEAVTGMMNGAFFGPHAEQVGGVFSINGSRGTLLIQDAFVGQQHR